VPSTYQPRRPSASPLWQVVRHGWDEFLANYEAKYRQSLGPLHPAATVESFLRCGDLAFGFTRLQCPDYGHERLLAFTCKGRAEYLLRHSFSLQKITRNAVTRTVISRSKRHHTTTPPHHHTTKRNFEIFKAPDFISAALLHLPPKAQQTVRYYGVYSNKTRGQTPLIPDRIIRPPSLNPQSEIPNPPATCPPLARPHPPGFGRRSAQVPLLQGHHDRSAKSSAPRPAEGLIQLPRPPPPPFDIDTVEPIELPWQVIKEWIPDDEPDLDWFNRPRNPSNPNLDRIDQSQTWKAPEPPLDDGRVLVLEYT